VGVSDWEKKSRAKIAIFPRMLGLSQHFGNEFPLVYIAIPTFPEFRKTPRNFFKSFLYIDSIRGQSGKIGINIEVIFSHFPCRFVSHCF
jgi:hypothetical protein